MTKLTPEQLAHLDDLYTGYKLENNPFGRAAGMDTFITEAEQALGLVPGAGSEERAKAVVAELQKKGEEFKFVPEKDSFYVIAQDGKRVVKQGSELSEGFLDEEDSPPHGPFRNIQRARLYARSREDDQVLVEDRGRPDWARDYKAVAAELAKSGPQHGGVVNPNDDERWRQAENQRMAPDGFGITDSNNKPPDVAPKQAPPAGLDWQETTRGFMADADLPSGQFFSAVVYHDKGQVTWKIDVGTFGDKQAHQEGSLAGIDVAKQWVETKYRQAVKEHSGPGTAVKPKDEKAAGGRVRKDVKGDMPRYPPEGDAESPRGSRADRESLVTDCKNADQRARELLDILDKVTANPQFGKMNKTEMEMRRQLGIVFTKIKGMGPRMIGEE